MSEELNRQQICAALGVSESTIRRLEQGGLPYTPVGARSKPYNLAEWKEWLRANPPALVAIALYPSGPSAKAVQAFAEECKIHKFRVSIPS